MSVFRENVRAFYLQGQSELSVNNNEVSGVRKAGLTVVQLIRGPVSGKLCYVLQARSHNGKATNEPILPLTMNFIALLSKANKTNDQ